MFRNIVVGISGGVDSAISALLLKQKGFNVIGAFMKNWDEFDETGICSGEQDYLHAKYTCEKLDIELHVVNYVKDYWNSVFSSFLEDYQNGITPNPDILCNKYIKFDLFYKYAIQQLQGDAIATGHYAKTSFGSYLENYKENGDVHLLIPHDKFKDQTFFLSGIQRHTLSRTMFPLGDTLKSDVKNLALKNGLQRLAFKKESTGICFVGKRPFKQFIKEYINVRPGNFVDVDSGKIVGTHNGIHEWTVGQRCRLASYLHPYFVVKKDVHNNIIHVALGKENPALYNDFVYASAPNWLCENPLHADSAELRCRFRFQHTKPLVECSVRNTIDNPSHIMITLEKPLRAITPGQYAVLYSQTACLGSARIISASRMEEDKVEELEGAS
ncbi:mitochondrial tRNA-specific 2-thiouridylase 1 [Eurosta solidaginis]|uniref:mitochondrial tRNA-specific 2-thiouridylase 1 n=1 Tax=Eurosta solidaginis TaxID=178769 RepID=UPI0035308436